MCISTYLFINIKYVCNSYMSTHIHILQHTLQHTATHTAQHTATHTAQHTATHCNTHCTTHCNTCPLAVLQCVSHIHIFICLSIYPFIYLCTIRLSFINIHIYVSLIHIQIHPHTPVYYNDLSIYPFIYT